MKTSRLVLSGLIALSMMAVGSLGFADQGDTTTAPVAKVTTPVYHPEASDFAPPLGKYDYTVSWEGIPAAEASISVEQEGLHYRIVADARTYSGVDLLYTLRYRAESLISAIDYSPIKTIIDQRENSTKRSTQISFRDNGDIETVRSKNGKDTVVQTLNTDNFTLDPFSASFLARSLDWKVGDTREFDTFNGKTRYIISLTAKDKVNMKVNGVERPVWVIVPGVRSADTNQPNKKLREAKIYVTADSKREVLQIVSSVFIGSVKTTLDTFTPSKRSPVTHVAQENQNHILK
ncbi:MAG: DUF3108 domain-containing protein [Deltaproteobacteria bacterium]|nr:DUF3108 domain-containing protein [Deltaproteobacteria bacterium]